jgi:hypothetical protein
MVLQCCKCCDNRPMLIRNDVQPSLRLARPVIAVVAGTVVGVLIQELLWILLDSLIPSIELNAALIHGHDSGTLLLALAASWLAGGFSGGLMAGLVGRGRWAAYVAGALLSLGAWLLLWLAWAEGSSAWWLALTPGLGAIGGGWAAQGLLHSARRTASVANSKTARP